MVFTYILKLDQEKHYTGITKNLFKRIKEHYNKRSGFTSNYEIVSLVFVASFENYKQARILEIHIKSVGARKYMNKIKFNDRYQLNIPIRTILEQNHLKSALDQLKMIQDLRTHF